MNKIWDIKIINGKKYILWTDKNWKLIWIKYNVIYKENVC
jgi:hypothetical protein